MVIFSKYFYYIILLVGSNVILFFTICPAESCFGEESMAGYGTSCSYINALDLFIAHDIVDENWSIQSLSHELQLCLEAWPENH